MIFFLLNKNIGKKTKFSACMNAATAMFQAQVHELQSEVNTLQSALDAKEQQVSDATGLSQSMQQPPALLSGFTKAIFGI